MEKLSLIQLTPDWRVALIDLVKDYQEAGEQHPQSFLSFGDEDFFAFLRKQEDELKEENLPPDVTPQTTFWLSNESGLLIGHVIVRHKANPAPEECGGHICFSVRPSQRGKGYGKQMLALALEKAAGFGLDRAMITCDANNIASARIIEHNGGELIDTIVSTRTEKSLRRYWIPVPKENTSA